MDASSEEEIVKHYREFFEGPEREDWRAYACENYIGAYLSDEVIDALWGDGMKNVLLAFETEAVDQCIKSLEAQQS